MKVNLALFKRKPGSRRRPLSNFQSGIIGGIIGGILPAVISIYINYKDVSTNRLIMSGNNLQSDKEQMMQHLFGITRCFVDFSDEMTKDSVEFNVLTLIPIYREQWALSGNLSVYAPSSICIKTSQLNISYLTIVQKLDALPKPISFNDRHILMLEYMKDYYEWLAYVRMKLIELNLSTMPEMNSDEFLRELSAYKSYYGQNKK